MPFRMRAAPRFNYGADPHDISVVRDGVLFTTPDLSLYLGSTEPLALDERDAVAEFALEESGVAVFSLEQVGSSTTEFRVWQREEALDQLMATVRFWWDWLSASRYRGRWREFVHRSALTLKLLTYAPTGAIIAAPTTSLPEQIGGERNWDYRYVWIRDAAFCVYALLQLGFEGEATAFMNFLTRCSAPDGSPHGPLQVMYGIDGRQDLAEQELTDLEGYRGSAPVRVGNDAARQLQLDIYGELMDSVYLYDKWARPLSSDQWEAIRRRTGWVCENWDQPDEGIWETRGGRQKFLYSRLMCWVAVERAIRMAAHRGLPADQVRWCRVGTRSIRPSCGPAGRRSSRPSFNTKAATCSTPRSSCFHSPSSFRPPIRSGSPLWTSSTRRWSRTPWSTATTRRPVPTGCRAKKEPSPCVRSGSFRP